MKLFRLFFLFIILTSTKADAWVTWKNGGWVFTNEDASFDAMTHFNLACEAYNKGNWSEASLHFRVITCNYANTEYGPDAAFYLGVSDYFMGEYEDANKAFDCYLKYRQDSAHFFEAVQFKYCIAEYFKDGGKRRLFSYCGLPKWSCGYSYAVEIYDQIVFAVPNNELAAKSLFAKADLLAWLQDFREAIDTYQIFLRRFPKHEMAPQCYLNILHAYAKLAEIEIQNADILAFAQLTMAKFAKLFPRDERLGDGEAIVQHIKELFAYGFYELGCYYERSGWCRAAAIYYNTCRERFPETQVAMYASERLQFVGHLLPAAPAEKVAAEPEPCSTDVPTDIEFEE